MFKLPQKIKDDIIKYKDNLEKFLKGEIKDTFFRGVRVPWGNYSQRGGKLLMSRLRIPAGILTAQQLKAIGDVAKNFADGKLHITTRQDIQIHNVTYENSIKIIEYLKDFDISSRGGGGNTVRNITACYLSGICPYEEFEVYKLAWGLSEYLLSLDESYNLPRKFKIAFSGCNKDCCAVGVNDVGFVALNGNFKVICGGGMGAKSAVGKILIDKMKPEDTGYVVKSIMNVFNKYGDRKNRHHNRLRFLIEDIGLEKFNELYNNELKKIKDTEYIALRISNGLPELPKIVFSEHYENNTLKYNLGKQKQNGYYYFELRIHFGEITSDTLIGLSELVKDIPMVNFRTTQRQNLLISNIPQDKIDIVHDKVKTLLDDYLYPETVLDIVSCKAATTCNLGICNAIAMAKEIVDELKKIKLDIDKHKDIKINISGCPNACGQHPLGTISLSGMARKVYNRTVPFYKVYYGGKASAENTLLAEDVGIVPARTVPKFIGEFILSENKSKDFLKKLINKYSYVPPYEEDKSYYIDFGKKDEFSLDGLSQGECGAGVIDMIESDLESAKQSLIKSEEKNFAIDEIKNALIYSACALLVVKGIDPKDEKEAVSAFVDKFIRTGICRQEFEKVTDIYDDMLLGKISKEQAFDFTKRFYEEVKNIYSLMDSNFNFPKLTTNYELLTMNYEPRTSTYDLRGTPCPINYVKTKLKLEELNIGDILEVYLDDGEPIQNVPKSLKNDGQELLKIEQVGDYFKVLIRKKV